VSRALAALLLFLMRDIFRKLAGHPFSVAELLRRMKAPPYVSGFPRSFGCAPHFALNTRASRGKQDRLCGNDPSSLSLRRAGSEKRNPKS